MRNDCSAGGVKELSSRGGTLYGPSWFGVPTSSSQYLTAAQANAGHFRRGAGTLFFPGPGMTSAQVLSGLGSIPSQQTITALNTFLVNQGYDAARVDAFTQALVQRGATDEDLTTILQLQPGEIMAGLAVLADRLGGGLPSIATDSGFPTWVWAAGLFGLFLFFRR
jgi:hypothetical protein